MALVVDPTTGAVVDGGIPADTGMLPMPVPTPAAPVATVPPDPNDPAALMAGFEASQAQQVAEMAPPVGPGSQLAGLQGALRGQPLDPAKAVKGGEQFSGTSKPVAKPYDWAGGEGNLPGGGSVGAGPGSPGGSVGASNSSYSPEMMALMAKDPAVADLMAGWDEAEARAKADSAASLAAGDAVAQAQREAEEKRHAAEQAELDAQQAALESHAALMEQARVDHERRLAERNAAADQAKARYLQDAATARAMVVDPSRPYTGAQGAMGAMALMGQAWLANMGPGSPVMPDVQGMIGRIIQDNIAAQGSNQANAWRTAESSDNVWNLAREGANDEVEAYQRYRGFLTEAYHTNVAVTAARFSGQKAKAAHQAALDEIAAAQQEYASSVRATEFERLSKIDKDKSDFIKSMQDNARMVQTARISQGPAWYNAETNRMEAKTRAKAAADEQLLFIDPTDPSRVLGVAQNPDAYKDGKAKLLGATGIARAVVAMQALEKDVKAKFNNGVLDAVSKNQATIDFDAVYNDLVSSVIRARTGAAATEKEREDLKTIFPRETILTSLLSGSLDFAQTWGQSASREIQSAKDSLVMSSRLGTSNAEGALPEHTTALGVSATAGERKPDNTIPTLISGGSGKIKGNARNPAMFMPVTIPSISSEVFDVLDVHKDRDMVMRGVPRPSTNMLEGDIQEEIGRDHPDNHGGVGADVPAYVANLYTLWLLTASPDEATAKRASDGLDEAARGEPEAASKARAFKTLGVPDEAELRNLRNTRTVWSGPLRDALVKGRLLEE